MFKLVNIYPSKAIVELNPPIRCVVKSMYVDDNFILTCLKNAATVEEILSDGNKVLLNINNYNKNNSVKSENNNSEKVIENVEITVGITTEDKIEKERIEEINNKIENKKSYSKKNKYKNKQDYNENKKDV